MGKGWLRAMRTDPFLVVAVVLSAAFCLHGIGWGRVEDWNPDQMAFHPLFQEGRAPFNPGWFLKPPFHTYLNWFLAVLPAHGIAAVFALDPAADRALSLLLARLITLAMLSGCVILAYGMAERACNRFAARATAALVATSAGPVAFAHFLTVDVPVTFWMLLALFFCQRILVSGALRDYLWAGVFTGIAVSCKYNGVFVGVGLLAAHLLRPGLAQGAAGGDGSVCMPRRLLEPRFLAGLAAAPIAFLLTNPFALLDARTFLADFLYNLQLVPVFDGQITPPSPFLVPQRLVELLGIPAFVLAVLGALLGWTALAVRRTWDTKARCTLVVFAVFVVYALYFRTYSHLPARFLLPIFPLPLLLAAPGLELASDRRSSTVAVATLLVLVVGYNVACSWQVGTRFEEDPRMRALSFFAERVPEGSVVAASGYSPRWHLHRKPIRRARLPWVSGRRKLYLRLFGEDPIVMARLDWHEPPEDDRWFREGARFDPVPDFVTVDSLCTDRFLEGPAGDRYPEVRAFYARLLAGRSGYRVVFDERNAPAAWWAYPAEIDFLRNRMVILERDDRVAGH